MKDHIVHNLKNIYDMVKKVLIYALLMHIYIEWTAIIFLYIDIGIYVYIEHYQGDIFVWEYETG